MPPWGRGQAEWRGCAARGWPGVASSRSREEVREGKDQGKVPHPRQRTCTLENLVIPGRALPMRSAQWVGSPGASCQAGAAVLGGGKGSDEWMLGPERSGVVVVTVALGC